MLLFAHVGLALASARLLTRANLAFIAMGSMLPDIIDKPLGIIIFGSPAMGRTIAHTLLFLAILAALSFYLRDMRIASLTWGVFIHFFLDSLWASPHTLFWPLLGPFPAAELIDTLGYIEMLLSGLANPGILLPELFGLFYITFLAYEKRDSARRLMSKLLKEPGRAARTILQALFKGA